MSQQLLQHPGRHRDATQAQRRLWEALKPWGLRATCGYRTCVIGVRAGQQGDVRRRSWWVAPKPNPATRHAQCTRNMLWVRGQGRASASIRCNPHSASEPRQRGLHRRVLPGGGHRQALLAPPWAAWRPALAPLCTGRAPAHETSMLTPSASVGARRDRFARPRSTQECVLKHQARRPRPASACIAGASAQPPQSWGDCLGGFLRHGATRWPESRGLPGVRSAGSDA
jgi:hypothetical protein